MNEAVTPMVLPHGTIVAVVDGAALKLFRNQGVEPEIRLVEVDHPSITVKNAGSGLRHRNDSSNPDVHRKIEDGFAAASAAELNHMALRGSLDRLLIIADPRTLGELRKHFHPVLRAKIVGEVPKDLLDHTIHDIATTIRHG